jgi:hypothetical protein
VVRGVSFTLEIKFFVSFILFAHSRPRKERERMDPYPVCAVSAENKQYSHRWPMTGASALKSRRTREATDRHKNAHTKSGHRRTKREHR